MKISIIGAGNIGTLMAAEFSAKGHEVTMYTRRLKDFSKNITVYGEDNNVILESSLAKITDKIEEAVLNKDIVWIVTPAYTLSKIASMILPFVKEGQYIGIVPGSGGAEFAFHEVIKRGAVLFGLQRVHSLARLIEYGHSVRAMGRKDELYIASIPASEADNICKVAAQLYNMPCYPLANYIDVTLTPSNQILHTARLYSMFKDYHEGMSYKRNFLFYEEWDDESSMLVYACGEELYNLSNTIPMNLSGVKSMCEQYENCPAQAMSKVIREIPEFKGLTSPMKKLDDDSWIPDFSSRYFTADFPYGIKILIDLADAFKVPAPNMKKVWAWYLQFAEGKPYFELEISSEEVIKLYSRDK